MYVLYIVVFKKASWVLFLIINLLQISFCLVFSREILLLSDTNARRFLILNQLDSSRICSKTNSNHCWSTSLI